MRVDDVDQDLRLGGGGGGGAGEVEVRKVGIEIDQRAEIQEDQRADLARSDELGCCLRDG